MTRPEVRVFEVKRRADGTEYLEPLRPVRLPPRAKPLTAQQRDLLAKLILLVTGAKGETG